MTDDSPKENSQFPMDFPCPRCKSTRRVYKLACEEVGFKSDYVTLPTPYATLFSPAIIPVSPKGLIAHPDICADCGQEYVCRIEISPVMPLQQAQAMGPGVPMPPGTKFPIPPFKRR